MDFFVTFVVVLGSVFLHCDKLPGWLCMQREGQACRPVLQHLPLWQGQTISQTQLQNSCFLSTLLSSSYLISSLTASCNQNITTRVFKHNQDFGKLSSHTKLLTERRTTARGWLENGILACTETLGVTISTVRLAMASSTSLAFLSHWWTASKEGKSFSKWRRLWRSSQCLLLSSSLLSLSDGCLGGRLGLPQSFSPLQQLGCSLSTSPSTLLLGGSDPFGWRPSSTPSSWRTMKWCRSRSNLQSWKRCL